MTSYPQLQAQFAQALDASLSTTPGNQLRLVDSGLTPPLVALIDALPYFGDPTFEQIQRAAFCNLLAVSLPNATVAPHPMDAGFGYVSSYRYTGPYAGYQAAFYPGVSTSPVAAAVAAQVQSAQPALNGAWWSSYALTVLTDAVRIALSASLDTNKLTADLAARNAQLLPALAASYLAVYTTGYAPTQKALASLTQSGQAPGAAAALSTAISQGQFTSNINQAISMGGDSTNAAVWFLFNLWITLKALGASNVDAVIAEAQGAGLRVPAQIAPSSWWNGGYTSWYLALGGADLSALAGPAIAAVMPETESTSFASTMPTLPVTRGTSEPNGYAKSLCYWGSLAAYPPPSSSCFGAGTQVLMADGSSKSIEAIQRGDEVQTNLGKRKVVLVESPLRQERTLHQINGLAVFATSAHPFRSGARAAAKRAAVDPWALMDSQPSMVGAGVARLREGSVLSGRARGEACDVPVTTILALPARDADERVFDLLLEDWTRGYAAYYVGGPDLFLAVDAETADPSYDLACTVSIVSALHEAIAACRESFPAPEHGMREAIAALGSSRFALDGAAPSAVGEPLALPAVPDASFFMRDERWDAHASLLEAQLVRQHARAIRRRLRDPLRARQRQSRADAPFGLSLRDIELLGDVAIAPDAPLVLALSLRGWGAREDSARALAFAPRERWFVAWDRLVAFDDVTPGPGEAAILGHLSQDGRSIGSFRCNVTGSAGAPIQEHFVYDGAGEIVARVALQEVRVDAVHTRPQAALGGDGATRLYASATALGQALGQELNALGRARRRTPPRDA